MSELADRPLRLGEETILIHWWRTLRWFMNLRLVPRWSNRYEQAANLLTRIYRRLFYDGLTRTGKMILFCSLLIFLLSYRAGSNFLLFTAALGFSLLLWSAVLGFFYRPRVRLQRQSPAYAVAGKPLCSQINLLNEGRRPLQSFSIRELIIPNGLWPGEWLRPYQMSLSPGQETKLTVCFEPQKRGVFLLSGLAVQSYFPFFLSRYSSKIEIPAEVYVLPPTLKLAVPSLRHIAEQASKRLAESRENSRKGPALEYAFSRPYQSGDSIRRLDHRASSRRGEPMTKVFEGADNVRRDQVYLMVDLSLADFEPWQRRPLSESALDERLALAVEIGLSAQNEGFTLTALATSEEWQLLENTQDFYKHIASCRPKHRNTEFNKRLPNTVLTNEGVHILVVGRWDIAVQSQVDRWRQAGLLVLVFLLAESAEDSGALPSGNEYVEVQH